MYREKSSVYILVYIKYIIILLSIVFIFFIVRQPINRLGNMTVFTVVSSDMVDLNSAKKMLSLSLPSIEFVDNKENKRFNLLDELKSIKDYVLGIGGKEARDIIAIEFGMNTCKKEKNAVQSCISINRTNIEGVSSITNETDKKELDDSEVLTAGKISVTNETNYSINIEKLLKEPLKKKFNKNSKILIYHTHTNECFINEIKELENMSVPSRSDNENINVIKIGGCLAENLNVKDLNTIHSKKYHNIPSDVGAYGRSLNTVEKYINEDKSIDIILDIHRDGISNSKKLRLVNNFDGKNVAKIMFVVGTDSTGLEHPQWKENLKFALRLQEKLISYNPNLVKPVFISKNRYNQHLVNSSLIIEIGGDGNLVSEAIESTKYIAMAIKDIIEENS